MIKTTSKDVDALISQDQIGSLYDGIAPVYNLWSRLTESHAANRALELADVKDGQNILEVAVGTGIVFYELVKANPSGFNIGIDLSNGMLNKAIKRLRKVPYSNYQLSLGSAFDLNVGTESIDILVNSYMFDLIQFKDMNKILSEFKRVLKKEGKLVLINMTKGEKFGSGFYEFVYKISPRILGGCRGVQLKEKLENSGFTVHSREYLQQMFFPSEVILAHKK